MPGRSLTMEGNKSPRDSQEVTTLGAYLAQRLVEGGADTYFTVPGDYILYLLDELLKNPGLRMINCCNELNAGTLQLVNNTFNFHRIFQLIWKITCI